MSGAPSHDYFRPVTSSMPSPAVCRVSLTTPETLAAPSPASTTMFAADPSELPVTPAAAVPMVDETPLSLASSGYVVMVPEWHRTVPPNRDFRVKDKLAMASPPRVRRKFPNPRPRRAPQYNSVPLRPVVRTLTATYRKKAGEMDADELQRFREANRAIARRARAKVRDEKLELELREQLLNEEKQNLLASRAHYREQVATLLDAVRLIYQP